MNLDTLRLALSIVGVQTNAADLATPEDELVLKYEQDFDNGTGADQAQIIFHDQRTLGSSLSESLDLAGGLTHPLGGTITFTAIKAIIVKGAAANTGNLRVGAGVSNAFQGPFGASAIGNLVTPDGLLVHMDPSATGWAVTAGTGDLLRIENLVAASSTYDIIIVGEGSVA
jgi:hypothetical protein